MLSGATADKPPAISTLIAADIPNYRYLPLVSCEVRSTQLPGKVLDQTLGLPSLPR